MAEVGNNADLSFSSSEDSGLVNMCHGIPSSDREAAHAEARYLAECAPEPDSRLHGTVRRPVLSCLRAAVANLVLQTQTIQLSNCLPLLVPGLGGAQDHAVFVLLRELPGC